jgi:hypothetical protein
MPFLSLLQELLGFFQKNASILNKKDTVRDFSHCVDSSFGK